MRPDPEAAAERARVASGDELKSLLHDSSEEVVLAALENPNLQEEHVSLLLERLDLSATVVGVIAGQQRWAANDAIRLRLVRHPRTPKRIALAAVRQLPLFDLVRVGMVPSTPVDIRRMTEELILGRVPQIPLGQKLTLARRGSARVAAALLVEGHPQVIKAALDSALLTESQVLKVLASPAAPPRTVAAISQHRKWSQRYNVRAALVRNSCTPPPAVLAFLPDLTLRDLQDISTLEDLAPHLRKYIAAELERRASGAACEASERLTEDA